MRWFVSFCWLMILACKSTGHDRSGILGSPGGSEHSSAHTVRDSDQAIYRIEGTLPLGYHLLGAVTTRPAVLSERCRKVGDGKTSHVVEKITVSMSTQSSPAKGFPALKQVQMGDEMAYLLAIDLKNFVTKFAKRCRPYIAAVTIYAAQSDYGPRIALLKLSPKASVAHPKQLSVSCLRSENCLTRSLETIYRKNSQFRLRSGNFRVDILGLPESL